MIPRVRETIDITVDGRMAPPRVLRPAWPTRVFLAASIIAVLAVAGTVAALLFWVASLLIPVALVAGLVAYAAFKLQLWRAGQTPGGGAAALRGIFRR